MNKSSFIEEPELKNLDIKVLVESECVEIPIEEMVDAGLKFLSKYKKIKTKYKNTTSWSVIGPEGAVEFITYKGDEDLAGLEIHYRVKPGDNYNHSRYCSLLDGECWHDGTSLYAIETLLPMQRQLNDDAFFSILEGHYRKYFLNED